MKENDLNVWIFSYICHIDSVQFYLLITKSQKAEIFYGKNILQDSRKTTSMGK